MSIITPSSPEILEHGKPYLSTLPTELLLHIYSHISGAPEKVVWPLICKRFYSIFTIPRWNSWSGKQQSEILLLLERCSFSHIRLAICHGPCTPGIWERESFAPLELHHSFPHCWQCAKYLWISPNKQFSYRDITPFYCRSRYSRDPPTEEENEGVIVRHAMYTLAIRHRHRLLTVPESAQVSHAHMAVLLSRFALPVCPHMRINDPRVIRNYDPKATPIEGPALFDGFHAQDRTRCTFPGCQTEIFWLIISSTGKSLDDGDASNSNDIGTSTRQKTIYLRTTRVLGDLHRFSNPLFLAQLIIPNTEKLTDYWRQCHEWKDDVAPMLARRYAQETSQNSKETKPPNARSSPDTSWTEISQLLTLSPFVDEDPFIKPGETAEPLFWPVYSPEKEDSEWTFFETDIPKHLSQDRSWHGHP